MSRPIAIALCSLIGLNILAIVESADPPRASVAGRPEPSQNEARLASAVSPLLPPRETALQPSAIDVSLARPHLIAWVPVDLAFHVSQEIPRRWQGSARISLAPASMSRSLPLQL